jgi:hypothetical protein
MEIRVFFSYEKRTIQIMCTPKEEMLKVFEKFASKLQMNINDFEFFYEGNKINKNLTILELINNDDKKEVVITVEKKIKIMKCPQCICNDCIITIDNYKINFSNCKYKHNIYKIFDEYKETQKIDHSKIICGDNKCGVNQKDCPSDFYKCLKCTQLVNRPRYLCDKCNAKHDGRHKRIKYDEKNYYCEEHFEPFTSYCLNCKKDLCNKCQKDQAHTEHNIKPYKSMNPEINKIKTNLGKIKDKINDLQCIIDNMKDLLDGTMKILEQYCEIEQDIIEKYELYNEKLKNYRVLKSLNNLNVSNKKIMDDLIKIINEKDLQKQINILIDIYEGDRKNYKEGIINKCDSSRDFKNNVILTENNIIFNNKYQQKIIKMTKNNSGRKSAPSSNNKK